MWMLWHMVAAASDWQVLYTGPILADGKTPTTLQLHLPGVSEESPLRVRSKHARGLTMRWLGPERLEVELTPRGDVEDSLELRVVARRQGERTWTLPAVSPTESPLEIKLEPEQLLHGDGEILVRILDRSAQEISPALSVSRGSVTPPIPEGDGVWLSRYTPPVSLEQPLQVSFYAADPRYPDRSYTHAALPVLLKQYLVEEELPPGAKLIAELGDRRYGPLVADESGEAQLTIERHPSDEFLKLKLLDEGEQKSWKRSLDRATQASLTLFPLAQPLMLEAGAETELLFGVLDDEAEPWSAGLGSWAVEGEGVEDTQLEDLGGGVFALRFTPAGGAWSVTLTDGEVSELAHGSTLPAAPRWGWTAGESQLEFFNPDGPLGDRWRLEHEGQRPEQVTQDGRVQVSWDAAPGWLLLTPQRQLSQAPAQRIQVWAPEARAPLVAAVVDAHGVPVACSEMVLRRAGSEPITQRCDSSGLAVFRPDPLATAPSPVELSSGSLTRAHAWGATGLGSAGQRASDERLGQQLIVHRPQPAAQESDAPSASDPAPSLALSSPETPSPVSDETPKPEAAAKSEARSSASTVASSEGSSLSLGLGWGGLRHESVSQGGVFPEYLQYGFSGLQGFMTPSLTASHWESAWGVTAQGSVGAYTIDLGAAPLRGRQPQLQSLGWLRWSPESRLSLGAGAGLRYWRLGVIGQDSEQEGDILLHPMGLWGGLVALRADARVQLWELGVQAQTGFFPAPLETGVGLQLSRVMDWDIAGADQASLMLSAQRHWRSVELAASEDQLSLEERYGQLGLGLRASWR